VDFDIDCDGSPDIISWTDPSFQGGFLVLDRNGNGTIDGGSELFGQCTAQPASADPNGFIALGVFDRASMGGNEDGQITNSDSIFEFLRIWVDSNHDGVSQASELTDLSAAGVRGIELDYVTSNRRDPYGNTLRWASMVHFEKNKRLAASDVIFVDAGE